MRHGRIEKVEHVTEKSLMGSWLLAGILVYPVLLREAVRGLSDSGARERAGDPRRGLRPAGHGGERGDGPAGGWVGAGAHQRRRPADPPAADAADHVGDAGPLPLRPERLLSVAHVRTGQGLRGARLLAGGVRGPGRERRELAGERLSQRPRSRRRHQDRKSTRLNSSHLVISYAVFCLKKKKNKDKQFATN